MGRILIVEDEPDIRDVFQRGLAKDGHEVETAADGRTAHDLVFAGGSPYDLILTDLFLPRMSGVEFLRAVQPVIQGRTPFVVISGIATLIEELGELVSEAAAIVHKPVDLHTILQTVRTVLGRPRPERRSPRPVEERLEILLRQNEDLFQRVRVDALTDLPNRRRWLEDLRVLEANARRHGTHFALAMVDIDDFGRFNKLYGLESGDNAIRLVARVLRAGCREGDSVYRYRSGQPDAYRYAGDEFLVVLAADDLPTAVMVMNRIRGRLATAQRERASDLPPEPVTFSAGVAIFEPGAPIDCDGLFEEAQRRMRKAKADGGNAVRPAAATGSRFAPAPARTTARPSLAPFPTRGPGR